MAPKGVLLCGETGSGKTTALAKLTDYGTVVIFDFDQQAGKLFELVPEDKSDRLIVYSINPNDPTSPRELATALRIYRQGTKRADFVVADSLTAMQDLCKSASRVKSGETEPGDISWDGGYRLAADHFDVLMDRLYSIPCTALVCTAHFSYLKNKDGNIDRVTLSLPGRMVTHLPRRFGAIFTAKAIPQSGGGMKYEFTTRQNKLHVVRAPLVRGWPEVVPQEEVWDRLFGGGGAERAGAPIPTV